MGIMLYMRYPQLSIIPHDILGQNGDNNEWITDSSTIP